MLWTPETRYFPHPFELESQLEGAIQVVAASLFGPNRIYLPVKKLIGKKGKTQNIPDAYLIDLASKTDPRIFVVENELAIHDALDHIAVQILQFSLSFETSPFKVKSILKDALKSNSSALQICERYADANGFDNLDFLLERMIRRESAFNALVIIDELDEELKTVLLSRFKFPVEILTLERFKTASGDPAYSFKPFLADVTGEEEGLEQQKRKLPPLDPAELDTIVVPAQEEGFKEVFLKENRWHHIRMDASMIPKVKYIAAYQVSPISAITHIATVRKISLWGDTSKYVLDFAEPAKEIGPKKLVPKPQGIVSAPQSARYTSYKRLINAATLDEVF